MLRKNLELLCRKRGLNQSDLSRLAGVSRQAVSLWFKKKGDFIDVRSRNLDRLCRELRISPNDLLKEMSVLEPVGAWRAQFFVGPALSGFGNPLLWPFQRATCAPLGASFRYGGSTVPPKSWARWCGVSSKSTRSTSRRLNAESASVYGRCTKTGLSGCPASASIWPVPSARLDFLERDKGVHAGRWDCPQRVLRAASALG